ncbi:MAG: transglycosylase SLT domain-containing protein [Pseudomonadota bacterium]
MRAIRSWRFTAAIVFTVATFPVAIADDALLADQRAAFRNAWSLAERGEWQLSPGEEKLLKAYTLWPYLRGRYLEATLRKRPAAEINQFLADHGTSRPARSLRYRWARQLHKSGDWLGYLGIYRAFYKSLGNTELDCRAVAAQIAANEPINGALALSLWRVGHSQHATCDPVFAWLTDTGLVSTDEIRERFDIAIEAREFGLARWLAKKLGPTEQATAARWIALRDRPAKALGDTDRAKLASFPNELRYGVGRLARDDTTKAMQRWRKLQEQHDFPPAVAAATTERIALIAAWRHEAHAAEFIAAVPPAFASLELAEWRVRDALRRGDMVAVQKAIAALPTAEREQERWRYWLAIAVQEKEPAAARLLLDELAGERSYYGFLAADRIERAYTLGHRDIVRDRELLTELRGDPSVHQALELHAVGLNGRARAQWDSAMQTLSAAGRQQAALLAAESGWVSRSIAAVAKAGHYDDLAIRYPTPWYDAFAAAARDNEISVAWTYGIARSESLFMPDVRSSAGAVGVMQLLPSTARSTARAIGFKFRGITTLTDATSNIRLGTRYLAGLAQRFEGHEALATAAYNAGPHRVDRWLEGAGGMPADVWVETIPFDETRGYVQRVLAARAVFHWRLTDAQRRVSQSLPPIPPVAPRVARLDQ